MLFFIFLGVIPIASQITCTDRPFPKVLGGFKGDTKLYNLDYHDNSETLVAVGSTVDWQLRRDTVAPTTSTTYEYAMIVLY